jgi:threonine/homoserine/homoserine lactone efflux protein
MSRELFTAFVVFALVSLFTPGPNNLMLMASGVNYGFRRTLPHALGVAFGFGFLVLLVGIGLGAVFVAFPPLYTVLKFAGAAYLVYLAWLIARSGPAESGKGGRPLTFLQAAAFQWVNAKALVMAVGAVSTYAAVAAFPGNVGLISGVFTDRRPLPRLENISENNHKILTTKSFMSACASVAAPCGNTRCCPESVAVSGWAEEDWVRWRRRGIWGWGSSRPGGSTSGTTPSARYSSSCPLP